MVNFDAFVDSQELETATHRRMLNRIVLDYIFNS